MISKTLVVTGLFCFAACASAQVKEQQTPNLKVEDLSWIAGCWETRDATKQRSIVEQWMAPDGGAMLGMSRTVKAGKMTGYEFLRIVSDEAGVKYVSRPSQNTTDTDFRLSKASVNEVTFSNPEHDFPQRIIYRRDNDKLSARIEAGTGSKVRGIDFVYSRVSCN